MVAKLWNTTLFAVPENPLAANAVIFATSLPSVLVFILTSWQVGASPISAIAGDGG